MSRPSIYTEEIAAEICAQLATGKSLRKICEDPTFPVESTVRNWALTNYNNFFAQYARAKDIGLDSMADELLAIADTPVTGIKTVSKATGIETTEGDMIEHRRLQVDTRKWYLSKVAPKKYGDKLHQELTGADGAPLTVVIQKLTP